MINFNRFCEMMSTRVTSKPMSARDVENAFKVFDKEGTGFVHVKQLTEAMARYGERLTAEEMRSMIDDAMPDDQGYVDIAEFAKLLCST